MANAARSRERSTTEQRPHVHAPPGLVSGVVFLTTRRYIVVRFRPGTLRNVAKCLEPDAGQALLSPDVESWYPEATLHALMQAAYQRLAGWEPQLYRALVFDIALFGLRTRFRSAMHMGGAHRALQQLPELWQLLQSGPRVGVRAGTTDAMILVEDCPAASDPHFQGALMAVVAALLYAVSGVKHGVQLLRLENDRLELRVRGLSSQSRPTTGRNR